MEQLALLQPTQSLIHHPKHLNQRVIHQKHNVCDIAKVEDIDFLYNHLHNSDEFQIIQQCLSSIKQNEYVYAAEFYIDEENNLSCKIKVYKTNHVFLRKAHEIVNAAADWFYKSKLWFKITSTGNTLNDLQPRHTYDTLKAIIEEYREDVHVDLTSPVFSINSPNFRKKLNHVTF